jgi:beta-phosphoglucomutase-like phosphatase (HAD superfamily)
VTNMLMVKVSPAMKAATEEAAKACGQSLSEFVRAAVAERAGYDMSHDDLRDGRSRPKKYVSEEARKKAKRDAERERQQQRERVRVALERIARMEGAASLEDWLRRKGVPIDDAPTTNCEAEKVSA